MQKEEIDSLNIEKNYWMGSYFKREATGSWLVDLGLRRLDMDSVSTCTVTFYDPNWGQWKSASQIGFLRPVFILKNEAKIQSGEGTEASPYILEL